MTIHRRSLLTGFSGFLMTQIAGPSPAQTALSTVRMQSSWINDAEFTGYFAALDRRFGYYRKLGLDVQYIPGGPAVVPETSLLSGKADIALTTPETTAQYIRRDKVDLRIIGSQYQKSPIGVVSLASK